MYNWLEVEYDFLPRLVSKDSRGERRGKKRREGCVVVPPAIPPALASQTDGRSSTCYLTVGPFQASFLCTPVSYVGFHGEAVALSPRRPFLAVVSFLLFSPPLGSEQRIVDSRSRTLRWLSREKIVSTIFSKRKERKERGTIKERLFRYWKGYRVISTRNWFLQRVNTLLRALTALRESIKKGSIFYACKRSFPFTSLFLLSLISQKSRIRSAIKKERGGEGICLAECKQENSFYWPIIRFIAHSNVNLSRDKSMRRTHAPIKI